MLAHVIAILLVVVVAPIWIVAHYGTRWRTARMLSRDQERTLAELHDLAIRMEERVESLERILDAEAPGWRDRGSASGSPWGAAGRREHYDERA